MSVKPTERLSQKTGTKRKIWVIDICRKDPFSGKEIVYRHDSIVQTRRGAEEQHRRVLNSIADGTYWDTFGKKEGDKNDEKETPEMPGFGDFSEVFLHNYATVHNKHSEVLSKRGILDRYLLPAFGKLKLDGITPRNIDSLTSELSSRGLHPKTINNALATLRRLLNYAEEMEYLDKVPRIRLLQVPEPRYDFLTFEELEQLLEAATYNPEWHAMIFFSARTGLRWGELSELRWSDVDLETRTVRVTRSFTRSKVTDRKNHCAYTVSLTPATIKLLRQHKHIKSELVFCKPDGGRHIHRRADRGP